MIGGSSGGGYGGRVRKGMVTFNRPRSVPRARDAAMGGVAVSNMGMPLNSLTHWIRITFHCCGVEATQEGSR